MKKPVYWSSPVPKRSDIKGLRITDCFYYGMVHGAGWAILHPDEVSAYWNGIGRRYELQTDGRWLSELQTDARWLSVRRKAEGQ